MNCFLGLSACHQAGSRPGGRPTFFASPKKVGKERRPGLRAPLRGVPCGARGLRQVQKLALGTGLKQFAPGPSGNLSPLRSSALRTGPEPQYHSPRLRHRARAGSLREPRKPAQASACTMPQASCAPLGPMRRAEERRAWGGVRSTLQHLTHRSCLSGAQRSEFCDAPQDRAPQGTPRAARGAKPGSPFFASFLWRSKERESAAGPRPGLVAGGQ